MSGTEDLVRRLEAITQKIEEAKTQKATAEGKISSLMERLKNEFQCGSLKEARTKVKELLSQIEKGDAELEAGVRELEEKLA